MKILLIATLLMCGLSAQASDLEKIIGDNDLVAVDADASNIPLKYRSLVDAIGKMNMGCTGTHIGKGYVLTAGHCFWAGQTITKDTNCADTTIEWGLREEKAPYMTSTCEKIIVSQKFENHDYALIKVSPIPPVSIAPEMKRRAAIGDTVTIFSHPDELPLRWSRSCGVERVQHRDLPVGTIQHKCDTNPGSSGAVILNSLSLTVVGIHDGGIWGDESSDDADSPEATGMNFGTFIFNSPLYEALREVGF